MSLVVDASVVAKLLFPEPYSDRAELLFQEAVRSAQRVVAPSLLAVEISNVIRKRMVRDGLTLAQGTALLDDFLLLPIRLLDPPDIHHRALALSAAYGIGAHDAHYVALSQRFGCDLWVDDRHMLRALQGRLDNVKWIGNFGGISSPQ